jgi:hypothetical protein
LLTAQLPPTFRLERDTRGIEAGVGAVREPPLRILCAGPLFLAPLGKKSRPFTQVFFHSDDGFFEPWIFRIHEVEPYMEPSKIVMRYMDGRILKGYTKSFDPDKPTFFLYKGNPETSLKRILVSVEDLKAIFFVRDFLGNPKSKEPRKIPDRLKVFGKKVEVTFKDREVLVGSILDDLPPERGFFLFPTNPRSNNVMIFAVSVAVRDIRFL